tara:strand:- start:176 stop:328 length:153 start_codon:yes stop_codon:yes gene_type:complete
MKNEIWLHESCERTENIEKERHRAEKEKSDGILEISTKKIVLWIDILDRD